MQFSEFLFQNYKESKNGHELIEFFADYKQNFLLNTQHRILDDFTEELYHDGSAKDRTYDLLWDCKTLLRDPVFIDIIETIGVSDFQEFEEVYSRIIEALKLADNMWLIKPLSHCLYFTYPKFCFPYFFDGSHYRLLAIFEEFGIYSPPVPKKKDVYARISHYVELCKSLYDFRQKYSMSEHELPAFLYGFAPNIVRKYEIDDVLPEPRHARFHVIVNTDADASHLDAADRSTVYHWSGSEETEPGDIIIKYCAKPRSSIHSIWQAITPGFLDPFFHYYKSVYVAHPIRVEPITIGEMRSDGILGQSPFARMGMQGANGKPIEKIYYDRILEMLAEKGMSLQGIPTLSDEPEPDVPLKNERDVEVHLLEPLLKRLGYKEDDWKRQMKLRMGRGERVYPDFVIFPVEERNNESGHQVWEAKFSIAGSKQLQEDFGQAKSYAMRLNCKGLGLISKEGVWFSEAKSSFSFEEIKFWSWKQISASDYFSELYNIAGKKRGFNQNH